MHTNDPAGAGPVDQLVRPGAEAQDLTGDMAWLWTHCRALGMTRKSESGLMRDDVALFVADARDAVAAERERCARIAETVHPHWIHIAAAIRGA